MNFFFLSFRTLTIFFFFFDNLHFDGDTKCGLANSISFSLSSKRFVKWMTMECMYVFLYECECVCVLYTSGYEYRMSFSMTKKQWRTLKRRRK